MRSVNISDAKAQLSALVDAVQGGEEIEITCYGEPKAKLVCARPPLKIALGFRTIKFVSDLTAPTDSEISRSFLDI